MLFRRFGFLGNFPGLYFDANGGGGAGGDGGSGAGAGGNAGTPEPKPITFKSQEELDAMFLQRRDQGKRQALDELFQGLGVKDADELKTIFTEGKKLKEGQQTELEKAANEKKAAEEALNTEKTEHGKTREAFVERLLKSEVRAEAKKAGFREESLDDVWMLVKAEHRTKITEKDDAFVGVDKVVEEIKKARPFWTGDATEKKPRTPGSPKFEKKNGDGTPTQTAQRPVKRL